MRVKIDKSSNIRVFNSCSWSNKKMYVKKMHKCRKKNYLHSRCIIIYLGIVNNTSVNIARNNCAWQKVTSCIFVYYLAAQKYEDKDTSISNFCKNKKSSKKFLFPCFVAFTSLSRIWISTGVILMLGSHIYDNWSTLPRRLFLIF